jgi:hypothetical protein
MTLRSCEALTSIFVISNGILIPFERNCALLSLSSQCRQLHIYGTDKALQMCTSQYTTSLERLSSIQSPLIPFAGSFSLGKDVRLFQTL